MTSGPAGGGPSEPGPRSADRREGGAELRRPSDAVTSTSAVWRGLWGRCSIRRVVVAGRTELRETRADVLAFPGLIAVVLIAVVIRQLFGRPPNALVFGVCAVLAVLDVALAWYLLRTGRATFAVTPDDITFTPRPGTRAKPATPQVIRRTADSALSFRLQSNGFIGGQAQYRLKLRDNATAQEVAATPFGRRKVRRACESQGWRFS